MRAKNIYLAILVSACAVGTIHAERRFHLPMEINSGCVTETVSGTRYVVETANETETVLGSKGNALRLDGYSNYISADFNLGDLSQMTFSVWCAMETWPIIEHDVQNESESTCIAGNYDSDAKKGFGFFITRTGRLSFKFYSGGWPAEITASKPLPLYQWNNLVAVADGSKVTLYNNGVVQGSTNCKSLAASGTMMIGKGKKDRFFGPFNTMTINGIIDEVEIYDEALSASSIRGWNADNDPQLTQLGHDRYANDIWRPLFHCMPTRNWTNETHGLIYHNGQYHLFFQKNANGPYMSRLQWGHLVSDNLCHWSEMPIAIGSDMWYDLKGCWSGCVAVDDVVTNGKPGLIYTGVDYARAMIGQAYPTDDDLISWTKPSNPIIDGRPSGLSDDFRDPFFFRNGDDRFIIVGTSKDGKGACTLHKYNNGSWTNDGKIFFQAANSVYYGSFWEMPNLTKLGDKYLFTATPLGLGDGVKILYWIGSLNSDGTFNTSATPASVEFKGWAKEGYGMLSPSIMQHEGKTIALGIVPDKLPSEKNYEMGWAHTYSLPREWDLNASGQLIQRPYSGLEALRANEIVNIAKSIHGSEELGTMNNRTIEVVGEFIVADADFGFTFFKNGDCGAKLYYSPSSSRLVLDMRSMPRVSNDENSFNGLYTTTLPTNVAKGSIMKIHAFVDRSIIDVFINDMWASSVRLFPTDPEAVGVDVFSENGSTTSNVRAYKLNLESSSINDVKADNSVLEPFVDVFTLTGILLRQNVKREDATIGLPKGIYIIDNQKVCVR